MNRDCALEQKLLARSHTPEKVNEIIAERYGVQGQSIIFAQSRSAETPTPLMRFTKQSIPLSTRKVIRLYIQQTTLRQRTLVKLLQKHRKRKEPMPLPLEDLLQKYLVPDFDDFTHMHSMWQSYMQNLLFGGHQVPALTMAARMATADFTGCIVTVTRSRDVNLVGVRGIVMWDAQLAFVLCVPRGKDAREWLVNDRPGVANTISPSLQIGGLRSIPKRKTVFSFDVELPSKSDHKNTKPEKQPRPQNLPITADDTNPTQPETQWEGTSIAKTMDDDMDVDGDNDVNPQIMTFSIIGLRFEIRLADRLGRKFKSHNIDDIY